MAVNLQIDRAVILTDGKLEINFSILVNGQVVASDSEAFPKPHELTLAQILERLKDRVRSLKEHYKTKAQVDTLVGQTIDVEP